MQDKRRRQCQVMGQCFVFQKYETSCKRVKDTYFSIAQRGCTEGIKLLHKLGDEYIKSLRQKGKSMISFDTKESVAPTVKIQAFGPKELIQDEPPFLQKTSQKRLYSFHKETHSQAKKKPESYKSSKKRLTEVEKLEQSLKKMDFLDNDQREVDENQDYTNMEQMKEKSLSEVLEESNKKVREKMLKQEKDPFYDSNSDASYPITDYQDNESSNDDQDYEVYTESNFPPQAYQSVVNLPSISQGSLPSGKFQASKILYSPKKVKRVLQNKKPIPRWAQDMDRVNEIAFAQQKDPRLDPQKIYGVCVIERLETNVMFNRKDIYARGSSARWNRQPYSMPK